MLFPALAYVARQCSHGHKVLHAFVSFGSAPWLGVHIEMAYSVLVNLKWNWRERKECINAGYLRDICCRIYEIGRARPELRDIARYHRAEIC
jgi:hypothetical protein